MTFSASIISPQSVWGKKSDGTLTRADFAAVNGAAVEALPALLARWLPNGRREAKDYVVRNPRRDDRTPGSFRIALHGPRAGSWIDHATGDRGGDPVSLGAFIFNIGQAESCRRLADMLGVPLTGGPRHG